MTTTCENTKKNENVYKASLPTFLILHYYLLTPITHAYYDKIHRQFAVEL